MEPIKTFSQWGRLKNHGVLSLPPSLPPYLSVLQLGAIHMTLADINNRSMKDTARSIFWPMTPQIVLDRMPDSNTSL